MLSHYVNEAGNIYLKHLFVFPTVLGQHLLAPTQHHTLHEYGHQQLSHNVHKPDAWALHVHVASLPNRNQTSSPAAGACIGTVLQYLPVNLYMSIYTIPLSKGIILVGST